jgi:hypothetical protein
MENNNHDQVLVNCEPFELPAVLKGAESKNEDIPIYRYVFCKKYDQELLVNFHFAPISRVCLQLKINNK